GGRDRPADVTALWVIELHARVASLSTDRCGGFAGSPFQRRGKVQVVPTGRHTLRECDAGLYRYQPYVRAMGRLILIIDPQIAFCDAAGSLSKAFGVSELSAISERLRDLEAFLTKWPNRDELCVVRSEYGPGQFTGGDLTDPYSQACVPGSSDDCDLSLPQSAVAGVRVFTKH